MTPSSGYPLFKRQDVPPHPISSQVESMFLCFFRQIIHPLCKRRFFIEKGCSWLLKKNNIDKLL